jgi:large subunit ribosomal protein L9
MKVILKNEVDNLGLPGDVVDVADGYGRNFLLPRGMAILATKGAMKEAEAITRARKVQEAATVGDAEAVKEEIESRTLRIPARVDERGHLYGSVSVHDIAQVLKERGHDIPRKRIELKGTLREIGTYEIPVRVHPQVTATVEVEVVDVEGVVGVEAPEVDEEDVTDAAAEAAEGSETDVDVLAEQALEAAQEYEQQQKALEAEREDADREAGTDQDPEESVTEG